MNSEFMSTVPTFDFSDPNVVHDCVLIVEGKKFYVNSGLLSIWSDYFKDVFEEECKESHQGEIEIKEVSAADFQTFLLYIYPTADFVTEHNVITLVNMAYHFLAPGILLVCKKFIDENFKDLDVFNLLEIAIQYEFEDIKKKVGSTIYASPLKLIKDRQCPFCQFCEGDEICDHPRTEGKFIEVNRLIEENAFRISTLSKEAQLFILQASVGNY